MITKVMRYQIIKPSDCNWDFFREILRLLQSETREILNKTIQKCWEYQGFSSEYKDIHATYPKTTDILGYSSTHGYCYDTLKDKYITLYSRNLSQTIKRATDKWKSDLNDILKGTKTIPNFKKDIPIDIVKDALMIYKINSKYFVDLKLIGKNYKKIINRESTSFNVLIKAGDNTQKVILERILSGEYSISSSQILNNKNKWFLNLTYQFEKEKKELDENKIMGVDLGIVNAAYVAFNHCLNRYSIEGKEIEEFRKRVEARKKSLLRQSKYCGDGRIGHGISTRIKPIENIQDKIAKFRDTTNHKYSRYIVDMAIKQDCGTIQMEDLTGITKENKFLKNWSYYDLQRKIEYKAKENGINVIYIEPNHTSQRCSKCGHIDKGNRIEQAIFQCKKCNFKANADFNAARNIAIKNIGIIIKETLINQDYLVV